MSELQQVGSTETSSDAPLDPETTARAILSLGLASLEGVTRILHYGTGHGPHAELLASAGASVTSRVPGTNPLGGRFDTVTHGFDGRAQLCVIETDERGPVIEPGSVLDELEPGAWVAVMGDAWDDSRDDLRSLRQMAVNGATGEIAERPEDETARVTLLRRDAVVSDDGSLDLLSSNQLQRVSIEFSSKCNLRCVYCALSQPDWNGTEMPAALLDDIVERLASRGKPTIIVSGTGETTTVEGWHERARRLLDTGASLDITSNFARTFSQDEIDVFAEFNAIQVSIDTADAELLKKLRRKVDLHTILRNIALVKASAIRRTLPEPRFSWSCVTCDQNWRGLRELVALGLAMGVKHFAFCNLSEYPEIEGTLKVHHVSTLPIDEVRQAKGIMLEAFQMVRDADAELEIAGGLMEAIDERLEGRDARNDRAQPEGSSYERFYGEQPEGKTRHCLDPWQFGIFTAKGEVLPCCWHKKVGLLEEGVGLDEIYDGVAMRALREQLLTGELSTECASCPARGWTTRETLRSEVESSLRGNTEGETIRIG